MATVIITLESACAGGEHAHMSVLVNGVDKGEYAVLASEILEPLTDVEISTTIAGLIKLGMIGRTKAQMRAVLQAGYEVTTE
jgi:hypothetical protein